MYVCMHACMHTCMYVCMYACVYVMYVCMYVYEYMSVCRSTTVYLDGWVCISKTLSSRGFLYSAVSFYC
jgi:hypothetical protein